MGPKTTLDPIDFCMNKKRDLFQNVIICVPQKKVKWFEWHEDKNILSQFRFFELTIPFNEN